MDESFSGSGHRRDVAASVRQRLLNLARQRGEEFQRLLTLYGMERLLYRLSVSPYRDEFVLKGALLFSVWEDAPHRRTRDLDLLGRGDPAVARLTETVRAICGIPVPEDGVMFHAETVQAREIREDAVYGGIRVTLTASLGTARLPVQIDVGFGDVVTPGPAEIAFPTLLDMPAPRLLAYPRETVIAEKLDALVTLGQDNSRMKDLHDLWALSRTSAFHGPGLREAVAATFARRRTVLPGSAPVAFTLAFHDDAAKRAQWRAFVARQGPDAGLPPLTELMEKIARFLLPVLDAIRSGEALDADWPPGGPWDVKPHGRSASR